MLSIQLFNFGSKLWGKKWRVSIMHILRSGEPMRFSQIKKELPHCSVKVLSETLSEMERFKLIIRTQYESIPVRVEYELNPDLIELDCLNEKYLSIIRNFLDKNPQVYNMLHEPRSITS